MPAHPQASADPILPSSPDRVVVWLSPALPQPRSPYRPHLAPERVQHTLNRIAELSQRAEGAASSNAKPSPRGVESGLCWNCPPFERT